MSDDRKLRPQVKSKSVPQSARLSELLDQLGPDHAPAPLFAASKSRKKPDSFGADLRPITNILRDPNLGQPSGAAGYERPTRASRPLAMPRMSGRAQGSDRPQRARAGYGQSDTMGYPAPQGQPRTEHSYSDYTDALPVEQPAPEQSYSASPRHHTPAPQHYTPAPQSPQHTPAPQPCAQAPQHQAGQPQQAYSDALPMQQPAVQQPGFPTERAAEGTPVPHAMPARGGEIMAMFSARGGVGATTVTINTAAALAARGNEVVIVDLSLELGDVFVALDLESVTSLSAVARDAGRLDGSTLRRRLVRHESGVWAIGQDGNVDDLQGDLAEHLPALLSLLAEHFDYVLIDGMRSFTDTTVAALDAATQIHLVLGQDVMSVRRAAKAIALFRRLGYGDSHLRLAVSRMSKKSPVTGHEIERALGVAIASTFRDDAKRVQTALDAGALLTQMVGKGITEDIIGFAARVDAEKRQTAARAESHSEHEAGVAGFFRRLFKKGPR